MRGRAYTRYQRRRTIKRKRNILDKLHGKKNSKEYYPIDGTLSKGKIHCSCPMCRTKSYDRLSHSDLKKLERIYN